MDYTSMHKQINHIRFYFNQIERLEKALNDEQMGKLFFALARYARTFEREEVDTDLVFPYTELCYSIDKTRMIVEGGRDL